MTDIFRFLPPEAQLAISLDQYRNFIEIAQRLERERIIELLEIGGSVEQIICDYWGDPDFDKDDALQLIKKAIKGEQTGTPKELWDKAVAYGKAVEHDMIFDRTYDDEIMHNIWWCIKREDKFPSQEFIADLIRHFLLIKGEQK